MSQARHSSSHDLSASHDGAGLASLFSSPTPPVRKNMNSSLSMLCLALQEGRRICDGGKEGGCSRDGGERGDIVLSSCLDLVGGHSQM